MSEQRPKTPREIPWAAVTACLLILAAAGLSVAGVFVLVGPGWALEAGAGVCAIVSWLILRGMG